MRALHSKRMAFHLMGLCLLACVAGTGQALPLAQFRQNLGAQLPLNTVFRDAQGGQRHLRDYFGKHPVVLVFGYYHCPRLCSTVMDGVLQGLGGAGLPHTVLGVGIDPRETADDAARKLDAYLRSGADARELHLLTGHRADIRQLAEAAGFDYAYDPESDQYSHPAGFLIASPQGRITRYFSGLRFDRKDVRLALIEASDEQVGSVIEQIQLLCSHYDPLAGRYTLAVMSMMRVAGVLTLLVLVAGVAAARRRSRKKHAAETAATRASGRPA
ncbi:SCO family protein [Pusillimonas noertemannii]|uniref:SCO family protein n=1 Tax=Pusillimonas noertemannii TaxID=305977 RepID=UPI0012FE4A88|nr:SCO family protein [Pusillimonas noertemannii]